MAKTFLSVKKEFMSFLSEFSNLYLYSKRGNEEVQKSFWKAYELAKKKNLLIYFPSLLLMLQGCGLDTLLFFNEKGEISPCIFLSYKTPFALFGQTKIVEPLIFGNVLKEDPLAIWEKKEFSDFREKLKTKALPNECVYVLTHTA